MVTMAMDPIPHPSFLVQHRQTSGVTTQLAAPLPLTSELAAVLQSFVTPLMSQLPPTSGGNLAVWSRAVFRVIVGSKEIFVKEFG